MLIWLKIRLVFYLLIFAIQIAIIKIGKQRLTTILLSSLLLFIWLINLSLFKQKSQTKIELIPNQEIAKNTDIRLELGVEEINQNLEYYQELKRLQPSSRDLLHNLAQLETKSGQLELATNNLNLSRELDPNF